MNKSNVRIFMRKEEKKKKKSFSEFIKFSFTPFISAGYLKV